MRAKHGLCIALAAAVGFAAGLATASRPPQYPPHRPTPGPTVSVPRKKDRYPIVLEDRELPGPKGRLFHTGNILFLVFPVETVVSAVLGQMRPVKGGLDIKACGRNVTVRWAPPGKAPNLPVTGAPGAVAPRPRWPLLAGEFDHPRPLDPMAGIWLHGGRPMASSDWLWQVLSIHTEFRQAGLTVEGCLAPDGTPQRPENTLSDYFSASAARDSAAVRRLLTAHRWQNSLPWSEDPNLISLQLRAIGEPREDQEESYRVTHPEFFAVRALPASFEVKFKEERSVTSGTHAWVYYLVRERPDSPWLIADWGH